MSIGIRIFCPLANHPKSDGLCSMERCRWWQSSKNCCIIEHLATDIEKLMVNKTNCHCDKLKRAIQEKAIYCHKKNGLKEYQNKYIFYSYEANENYILDYCPFCGHTLQFP